MGFLLIIYLLGLFSLPFDFAVSIFVYGLDLKYLKVFVFLFLNYGN